MPKDERNDNAKKQAKYRVGLKSMLRQLEKTFNQRLDDLENQLAAIATKPSDHPSPIPEHDEQHRAEHR